MIVYRAELQTRNFEFEAIGDDPDTALTALVEGLQRHGTQYRIGDNWWREYAGDIVITRFEVNAPALRDREPILR